MCCEPPGLRPWHLSLPSQTTHCFNPLLANTSADCIPLAGEFIPVRCEPLDLAYIDGMLLLPLIIEHTIGKGVLGPSGSPCRWLLILCLTHELEAAACTERSPPCGRTTP